MSNLKRNSKSSQLRRFTAFFCFIFIIFFSKANLRYPDNFAKETSQLEADSINNSDKQIPQVYITEGTQILIADKASVSPAVFVKIKSKLKYVKKSKEKKKKTHINNKKITIKQTSKPNIYFKNSHDHKLNNYFSNGLKNAVLQIYQFKTFVLNTFFILFLLFLFNSYIVSYFRQNIFIKFFPGKKYQRPPPFLFNN